MKRIDQLRCSLAVAVLAAALSSGAVAQKAPATSAFGEKLVGFWMPRPVEAAPAALRSDFKARSTKVAGVTAEGITLEYAEKWCVHRGMPSQMTTSGPIGINVGGGFVGVSFPVANAQRYIYADGRKRPAEDTLDNTTTGYSVGRWEPAALVVDTAAFSNAGVREIPGGGWRGEKSRLMERFTLSPDGKVLTVRQTWTDPTVFMKPQVVTITYDRAPADYAAVEKYCDARDAKRAEPILVGKY